jgi:hypothetical protein
MLSEMTKPSAGGTAREESITAAASPRQAAATIRLAGAAEQARAAPLPWAERAAYFAALRRKADARLAAFG